METMIRRNPITGIYENVPAPEETEIPEKSNVQTATNNVKLNTGKPTTRGKP